MGEKNIQYLLRTRRKELGLTMKEVARAVNVSEATVSRWESGNIANMGRDKIYALSKILKVSPAEIMGIDDSENRSSENPEGLDDVYFSLAKELQDGEIDPDDIRLALETIKNMKNRKSSD